MNIELHSKSARISQTCSFVYETSGGSITIGGYVISVTKNWNGFKITTRAKTFAINISESDLR